MKMVIVFDTDDRNGMINTIKIVDNLAYEYMGRGVQEAHNRTFGKIEFIKMLRIFAKTVKEEVESEDPERDVGGEREDRHRPLTLQRLKVFVSPKPFMKKCGNARNTEAFTHEKT